MSSKKLKKKEYPENKLQNEKRENRLKEIEKEEREFDELEKIIAKSGNSVSKENNIDHAEENKKIKSGNKEREEDDKEEEGEDFFASLEKQTEIKMFQEKRESKDEESEGEDSLFGHFIEFFKENTKYAVWGSVFSIVVIALIVTLAVDAKNKDSDSNVKQTQSELQKNVLAENKIGEIDELVNTYFAALLNCNVDELSKIMDSMDNVSEDTLRKESEYIEAYENIKCYTEPGVEKGEYVVYVSYDNKIKNINTPAPGAVILYVEKAKGEKAYKIHNGIQEEAIAERIKALSESEEVKAFNEGVNERLRIACEKDADLKAFCDALLSSAQQGESAAQETVTEAVQPEQPAEPQPEQPAEPQPEQDS